MAKISMSQGQLLVRFMEKPVLTYIAEKTTDLCRVLKDNLYIQGDVPKNSYPIVNSKKLETTEK